VGQGTPDTDPEKTSASSPLGAEESHGYLIQTILVHPYLVIGVTGFKPSASEILIVLLNSDDVSIINSFSSNYHLYLSPLISATLFNCDRSPLNVFKKPFNLSNLYGDEIEGLHIPYVYAGSPGTVFGWHLEDYQLFSANYQLDGAAKVWYTIPA
jgi:hypothetical protein